MLRERSQALRTMYTVIPFIRRLQSGQAYRDRKENRKVAARGPGREEWAVIANGCGVSFGGDEDVLETGLMVAQLEECAKNHKFVHLMDGTYGM